MTEPEILMAVCRFIEDNFLYMKPGYILSEDDALLKKGIVDSMGVLEVLTFLEESFCVTLTDREVTEANLGSPRAIARFVTSKRAETAAA